MSGQYVKVDGRVISELKISKLKSTIKSLPLAMLLIIAANVVIAVITSYDPRNAILDYGIIPSRFRFGRLITSCFVHGNYVHLILNMLLLYIFGRDVEKAIGHLEFLLFYLGSCISASLLHIGIVLATLPPGFEDQAAVGASGAVAGIMGIYAVRFHRKIFRFVGIEIQALFLIMCLLLLQLGFGIVALYPDSFLGQYVKNVAYWSHLGGFMFGIVVALLGNMALKGERDYVIETAQQHYSEGNILEAVHDYESLLKYDPDNPFAHAEIGRLWAILQEEEQSLPSYFVAIELYICNGREDEAIATAEEMRRFWPDTRLSSSTRFRLASYLEETGQLERAVSVFKQIAIDDPDSAEAQMSLLKVGQLQLSSFNDKKSSLQTLSNFIKLYPDSEWRQFADETIKQANQEKS